MWGEILRRVRAAGWLLAQLLRPIALPTARSRVPSVVTVTEEMATDGLIWTRLYARRRSFPQVIHSSKRFAGRTGLEEYVGSGVGMALRVAVQECALVFRSDGYFTKLLGPRFFLPAWATPGALWVTHAEIGAGRFRSPSKRASASRPAHRQTAAFRACRSWRRNCLRTVRPAIWSMP